MRRRRTFIDNVGESIYKISVLLAILLLLVPVFIIIITSFDPNGIVGRLPTSAEFTLKWYHAFIEDAYLIDGFRTSLIVGASCGLVTTVIGICTAYVITRYDFRGKNVLTELLMSPSVFPGVTIGLSFMYMFIGLGLRQVVINLIIAHVVICFPLGLRPLIAAFETFDITIEKSALVLGATRLRAFIEVVFPDIIPGAVASFLFAFALSFDDVAVAVFLTDIRTTTFPVAMLAAFRRTLDPRINVGSTFLFIMAMIMVLVIEKSIGLEKVVRSVYAR